MFRTPVELPLLGDRRPFAAVLAANVVSVTGNALTAMGVSEELRSRVLSATTASTLTITPLGGLAAGFLVDSVGLFTTMLTFGGVYLLATLSPVIFPVWRQLDSPGLIPQGSGTELG
ncbi:hypothetical protein P3T36_005495 [Kitasatospora sp. MAP12-15]|uniref:hypothetical protein n=1 Tax=unclassified Kitasatospora TaxID=2633591 RepID=UPI00247479B4|nr:hypothetical protein [Kitasatospora sp. MAP12-44]MDH6108593.1 hypothetical protein [Kitasatospora sp. MAP12-44]